MTIPLRGFWVLIARTFDTIQGKGVYFQHGERIMTVAEIKKAVLALPEREFGTFSSWFDKYEDEHWDRQLERDQKAGPLRNLMDKARSDFEAGKCTPL